MNRDKVLKAGNSRELLELIYQDLDAERIAGLAFAKLSDRRLEEIIESLGDLVEIAKLRLAS